MTYKDLRVALDGPGGAGKSTVAKAVAARAGLVYVDTGALYRTVGLHVKSCGIGMYDTDAIVAVAADADIKVCILLRHDDKLANITGGMDAIAAVAVNTHLIFCGNYV